MGFAFPCGQLLYFTSLYSEKMENSIKKVYACKFVRYCCSIHLRSFFFVQQKKKREEAQVNYKLDETTINVMCVYVLACYLGPVTLEFLSKINL